MSNPSSRDRQDELARRRALKEQEAAAATRDDRGQEGAAEDDDVPRFEWSDIFAMIIAAYQIIMPIVFLFIGVVVLVYFLFKLVFVR